MTARGLVLVTGATGYVGGRLLAALEQAGAPLRCLARRPEALAGRVAASTEVVKADCLDPATLPAALDGVETAYYLVHSMGSGRSFAALDEAAARHFGQAARAAGVRRIVYLGGLGAADETELSEHLRSRQQTGDVLRASGVPVVELRASIVIGSGSLSYEMVRALVERLPVMVCPRWVQVRTQPIAVDDLVAYVLAARDLPPGAEGVYEIGGPDVVSYRDIMLEYARQRGLPALADPGAASHSPSLEPLAGPGHAPVRPRGPQADREPAQPHRRDLGPRPDGLRRPAAPASGGDRARPVPGGRGAGRHPLVGRPLLRGPSPAVGREALRHAPGRQPDPRGGGRLHAGRSPP